MANVKNVDNNHNNHVLKFSNGGVGLMQIFRVFDDAIFWVWLNMTHDWRGGIGTLVNETC